MKMRTDKNIYKKMKKTASLLKKYNSFLITTHINPDGDALGSQIAMYRILKKMGKDAYMIAEKAAPDMYRFLPSADKIRTDIDKFNEDIDAVLLLDCSKTSRTGKVESLMKDKVIINIDHHPGKRPNMDYALKDTTSSGAAELIYELLDFLDVKLNKDIALLLYTGIATDTGSFRYENTTPRTHKIASYLVAKGADPKYVGTQVYETEPPEKIRLLALSLKTLSLYAGGRIATIKVTKDMYKKTNATIEETENFVNFPASVKGVEVSLLLKEDLDDDDVVKVSLRSKSDIKVNKIASSFGGGGHPKASGLKMKGDIDKVEKKVVDKIRKHLSDSS